MRERKKLRTREVLIRVSTDLVAEHGFDGVSVDQIAAAADISTRTFFNYFRTKEDAVVGWAPDELARVVDTIGEIPTGVSAFDALTRALRDQLHRRRPNGDEVLKRMRVIAGDPRLLANQAGRFSELEHELVAALIARRGAGEGDGLREHVMVASVLATTRATLLAWGENGGRTPLEQYLDAALSELRNGFGDTADTDGSAAERS